MDHLYFQFKVVDPSVYGDHFNLIILKILIKKEKKTCLVNKKTKEK